MSALCRRLFFLPAASHDGDSLKSGASPFLLVRMLGVSQCGGGGGAGGAQVSPSLPPLMIEEEGAEHF